MLSHVKVDPVGEGALLSCKMRRAANICGDQRRAGRLPVRLLLKRARPIPSAQIACPTDRRPNEQTLLKNPAGVMLLK